MSDRLKELYKTQVMEMAKAADKSVVPNDFTHELHAYNPMCGDKYSVFLKLENDLIEKAGMKGFGCAISKASTYLLTSMLPGKTLSEAKEIIDRFLALTDHKSEQNPEDLFEIEEFLAFAAAREFPERQACANLCWEESSIFIENYG